MPKVVLTLVAALALVGAGAASLQPAATPDRTRIVIATGNRTVAVRVEIADEPRERAIGLMHRRSLPRDAGMLFLYPSEVRGRFWMKNTLIPLSIAFFDSQGRILRILAMTPCRRDPCRLYDPGVAFKGALEVNLGAFRRWGVRAGSRIRLPKEP